MRKANLDFDDLGSTPGVLNLLPFQLTPQNSLAIFLGLLVALRHFLSDTA